jgi:hypothetical protein
MAIRSVRLDNEAEEALKQIRRATSMGISEALKSGLQALGKQLETGGQRSAYEGYEQLDLGPGGQAIAPAERSHEGAQAAVGKKQGR